MSSFSVIIIRYLPGTKNRFCRKKGYFPESVISVVMHSRVPNIESNPRVSSIKKNSIAQSGETGNWFIASVKAINAKPGPPAVYKICNKTLLIWIIPLNNIIASITLTVRYKNIILFTYVIECIFHNRFREHISIHFLKQ